MTLLPAFAVEGAQASGAMLRTVSYAGTAGQTGIVNPGSFKVTASGGSVKVAPGAAVAATRYAGSPSYNSYTMMSTSVETIPIPATGSGGGATRYIIARIDDPEHGGQVDETGIFWRLEQVGSITGLAFPFVPLAKIVQPASTATITNAMIEDLRKVAVPRRDRFPVTIENAAVQNLTSSTYVDWPSSSNISVAIPEWASEAIVRCDILEALHTNSANTDGKMTLMLGSQPAYTSERRYDAVWAGSTSRTDHTIVSAFQIPEDMRGTTQPLRVRGRRLNGTGYLRADTYTQVVYDIEFLERPA